MTFNQRFPEIGAVVIPCGISPRAFVQVRVDVRDVVLTVSSPWTVAG
jgi:hypothetical protein